MKLIRLGRSYVIVIPKDLVESLELKDKKFNIKVRDTKTLILTIE